MLVSQHAEVINSLERYHFVSTVSDIDPQLIAEYDAIGLTMSPAGKYDRESRYLRLVNALRSGKLKIADNCTKLLKEMMTMEWDGDNVSSEHHFDICDALQYCYTNAVIPEKQIKEIQDLIPTRTFDDFGHSGQDFG
jgi:phage terminase large subunit